MSTHKTKVTWDVRAPWATGTTYRVDNPKAKDHGQVVTIHQDVVIKHADGTTRRIDRSKLRPVE